MRLSTMEGTYEMTKQDIEYHLNLLREVVTFFGINATIDAFIDAVYQSGDIEFHDDIEAVIETLRASA